MTDKELRRMSRSELLQMLISQMKENQRMQERLKAAEEELQNRRIAISQTGSIAEAALKLNGVFEAAQAAAEQYLANLQFLDQQRDGVSAQIEKEARNKADLMIAEADEYSRKTRKAADEYYQRITRKIQALKDQDVLVDLILADERKLMDEEERIRRGRTSKP